MLTIKRAERQCTTYRREGKKVILKAAFSLFFSPPLFFCSFHFALSFSSLPFSLAFISSNVFEGVRDVDVSVVRIEVEW